MSKLRNITGWVVFAIAFIVYAISAERSGSLWDCGEFILGAMKLQVVHPPGAPLFVLIGRLFAWVASIFSDDPANISLAVNLLSGACSALAATLVTWITMRLGELAYSKRGTDPSSTEEYALMAAGLVAGLTTAFSTSIWFSAVEGEVYAMSTFFTALVIWAVLKWYTLPESHLNDRWLVFSVFAAGLSIGVHLLSLLTFPALALFYYFKKYKKHTILGTLASILGGLFVLFFTQKIIIEGIPKLWRFFELITVNSMGLPFHSGLIPTILIIAAILFFAFRYAKRSGNFHLHNILVAATMLIIGYSSIGVVMVRANAKTPINMNDPSDVMRLLPYINREQYGERALLRGPQFDKQPVGSNVDQRYGRVGDKYEYTDEYISYDYANRDKVLFPRMFSNRDSDADLYRGYWMSNPQGSPTKADNLRFFLNYQIGWMYWRYFMWNFVGRQNGNQGYSPADVSDGNWMSGLSFIDQARLYDTQFEPARRKNNKARNTYFFLPLIMGILGLIWHFKHRQLDAFALFALFIITGIGIVVYSNSPPMEPRERDYVLVGSFMTFAIWVGFGALAIFDFLKKRTAQMPALVVGAILALSAPVIMGFQNFDDHSRQHLSGARDYANNFLESCEPNAIIFTYGDNDTYPLWYAQEVEGIRTDVRVVNLSLIAVDWYINGLRRKVNDSPPLKMTLTEDAIRGKKRNILYVQGERAMDLSAALKFAGEQHEVATQGGNKMESYWPSKNVYLSINKAKAVQSGWVSADQPIESRINIKLPSPNYVSKKDLAMLDIINSNMYDRPIYFSVTTNPSNMYGLGTYSELTGLASKIVPFKNPLTGNQGGVNTKVIAENLKKFKWGGFDEKEQFVSSSFNPTVYAHKNLFSQTLGMLGVNKSVKEQEIAQLRQEETVDQERIDKLTAEISGIDQEGKDILDTYFRAFPHKNFAYDQSQIYFMDFFNQFGYKEGLKAQMPLMIDELNEFLIFYQNMDAETLQAGFMGDYQKKLQTSNQLLDIAKASDDADLLQMAQEKLAPYLEKVLQENQPIKD